jgi:hypothetical protein
MAAALTSFEPRKTPIQARATVTVEAFSEPILQILARRVAGQRERPLPTGPHRSTSQH